MIAADRHIIRGAEAWRQKKQGVHALVYGYALQCTIRHLYLVSIKKGT